MPELLYLRTARRRLDDFGTVAAEDLGGGLIPPADRGPGVLDLDAYLQLGIDAFQAIVRADEVIRGAVYNGAAEYDPQIESALVELLRRWRLLAEETARRLQGAQDLQNAGPFLATLAEARSMLRAWDQPGEMTDSLRTLRDQALKEHRHGETAEFI